MVCIGETDDARLGLKLVVNTVGKLEGALVSSLCNYM